MPFKVKDLMINLLPLDVQAGDRQACTGATGPCTPASDTGWRVPVGCACTYVIDCRGGTESTTRFDTTLQYTTARVAFGMPVIDCRGGASDTYHNTNPPPPPSGAASLAALASLKEQLKQQLAAVEQREIAIEETLLPKTVEEVDMLTKKLTDALEELKTRRKELQKPK